jgi:hypothetical protein
MAALAVATPTAAVSTFPTAGYVNVVLLKTDLSGFETAAKSYAIQDPPIPGDKIDLKTSAAIFGGNGGIGFVEASSKNGGHVKAILDFSIFGQANATLNYSIMLVGPDGPRVDVVVKTLGSASSHLNMAATASLRIGSVYQSDVLPPSGGVGGGVGGGGVGGGGPAEIPDFPLELYATACSGLEAGCTPGPHFWEFDALTISLLPNRLYPVTLSASVYQTVYNDPYELSRGSAYVDPVFSLPPGAAGYSLVSSLPAVPEPSSWMLLIAGFGITGAAARRQRFRARAAG